MANKKSHKYDKSSSNANPLWGGRFQGGPSEIMEAINASISFDKKLYKQDIKASISHASMLKKTKILSTDEGDLIIKGLVQILNEIEEGQFSFKTELEDIHMNIESRLFDIIGDVAGKLHTARSRNDQVATDFKLWVRDNIDILDKGFESLLMALVNKAEENIETLMPGFTHLQIAQPVTFGHHLMAYFEMFKRDRQRLSDCRERLNECPLGAAALAGTSFPIDRFETASALGFSKPTSNSMDSVSDRDFALEYLSCLSIAATHLSRFAEEIVIWSSSQFSFIKLGDDYSTGSSIMPQKRNPDAAELVRAKSGRIFGALASLTIVMKGLPLSYSKDMQEDKEPVFEATDSFTLAIAALTGMVETMAVNKENMASAAADGFSTATDIADWLVQNLNIPFRRAHHITGEIVKEAEQSGLFLNDVPIEKMQKIEPLINDTIYNVLTPLNSASSRSSFGGTSPEQIKNAISTAKETLK